MVTFTSMSGSGYSLTTRTILAIVLVLFILPLADGGVSTVRPNQVFDWDKCAGYPDNLPDTPDCKGGFTDQTTIMTDGNTGTSQGIWSDNGASTDNFITIKRTSNDSNQSGEIELILYTGSVAPSNVLSVHTYQSDANTIDTTAGDVQFTAITNSNNTIDITDIVHSMDGYGFYKLRVDTVNPQDSSATNIAEVWLKEYNATWDSYSASGCTNQNDTFYNFSGNTIRANVCGKDFVPLKTYDGFRD